MSGARAAFMGAILAVAVAVGEQGLVRLVDASGAKDQPAGLQDVICEVIARHRQVSLLFRCAAVDPEIGRDIGM